MKPSSLVLASASPRRAELLSQLHVSYEVLPAHASEVHSEYLTPGEMCQINAYRKAREVAKKHPDALVLGADTLVCLGLNVFGKPRDLDDARRILETLSGESHDVVTGVCLLHLRSHSQRLFAEMTRVTFRELTPQSIEEYLQKINPLDKAGAYAIQEHGEMVVEALDGSYTNVVGLPLERLRHELEAFLPFHPAPEPAEVMA